MSAWSIAARTELSPVRSEGYDAVRIDEARGVAVLAVGVGSHVAPAEAAALAADFALDRLLGLGPESSTESALRDVAIATSAALVERERATRQLSPPASASRLPQRASRNAPPATRLPPPASRLRLPLASRLRLPLAPPASRLPRRSSASALSQPHGPQRIADRAGAPERVRVLAHAA